MIAQRTAMSASGEGEVQRQVAEAQIAMTIAKRFPRDAIEAKDKIMAACSRVGLAEEAFYAYTKGGSEITGGTIKLMKALAQLWGNLDYGVKELSQHDGVSEIEAYAWDLETNTKEKRVFQVAHVRMARGSLTKLTDPRDIYEAIANQGARRLRACLEGVIAGDVIDAAKRQCEVTLANSGGAPAEQIKALIAAFAEFKVTPDMLARKLAHKLDAVNIAEVLRLKKIYRGIKDGFTTVEQEFGQAQDVGVATSGQQQEPPKTAKEAARRAAAKAKEAASPTPEAQPSPAEPEPAQPAGPLDEAES